MTRMRPIDLRFDPPRALPWRLGGRSRSPATRFALPAAGLALAVLAWTGWSSWQLQRSLGEARQTLARLQPAPVRSTPAPRPTSPKPGDRRELAAWTEAVYRLNTPWPAVLDALEALATAEVALIAIEPEGRSTRVRLVAEARDLPALLDYAQRLQRAPGFASVTLMRHDTQVQDPSQPLRLTLEVDPGLMPAHAPETPASLAAAPGSSKGPP